MHRQPPQHHPLSHHPQSCHLFMIYSVLLGIIFSLILCPIQAKQLLNKDLEKDKSRQLAVEVYNSTSITLRWTQLRGTDRSCPVQRYIIRLRQDGQKQARTWRFDGSRLTVTLHDLRPATVYHVRLQSIACDNQRKSSRWIKVTTNDQLQYLGHERQAPGLPASVRTTALVDSVIVTWLPPEDDAVVRGFIIGYGEGVPDVSWRYVNASQRNLTLKNLKSLTQYVISVRAFNNVGKGQIVYDIVYTKEVSASGALPSPTHLRSRMLSSTTALLQWTDPSLDSKQKIEDERYYNVYYQSLPNGKNLSVIVKALQVMLYDLQPNKQYRFNVRTIKGSTTSPFSDGITDRTSFTGSAETGRTSKVITSGDVKNRTAAETDEYDDYDDDEFIRTGSDVIVAPLRHGNEDTPTVITQTEFKAKRANSVVHESLARTLGTPPNTSTSTSTGETKVSFRFMVQYRISAYVTWPERPSGCAAAGAGSSVDETRISGYLFRYKTVDDNAGGEYVTKNQATNFILLEDLVPNTRYKYQVKYVMDRGGSTSAWSQESTLDTSYNNRGRL